LTASLTPPAIRSASRTAAAAGGSSNADTLQGAGGFLGLGASPANRLRSSGSSGGSGSGSRGRRRGGSSSSSSGVDVGGGVRVPERDWLVPPHGKMQLTVELDMPDWPEPDLVQVCYFVPCYVM
jgi:hypothetical protein